MNNATSITISIIIALALVGGTLFFISSNKSEPKNIVERKQIMEIGEYDSAHKHLSILAFIAGAPINFSQDKYMLKDPLVHFEESDGSIIHVHTTGVTLPFFFDTLGIDMQNKCIILDTGLQYCNTESNTLRTIINGVEIIDIESYELKHGDIVLVNYGNDDSTQLKFKFNAVSYIPLELME
ncbi:MAG TPA: hypothetical protein ENI76_11050 [Ignavibacteria bacterium]|nr:hypothetical protein [Ignavibacteria bacterium]